jgi:hypothetical protein
MLTHRPRLGCCATDVLPGRARLQRPRLVGQLGVVHLQRPAHGVAMPLWRSALRAAARTAMPTRDRGPVSIHEES